MRPKKIGIFSLVTTIFVVIGTSGLGAVAEGASGVFVDWQEPPVVSNLEGKTQRFVPEQKIMV